MRKFLLPVLVIVIAVVAAKILLATKPEPKKSPPKDRSTVVEIQELKLQEYVLKVEAAGVVKARTQSDLVAEVSGRIESVSETFQEGAYFNKGDVLLTLDAQTVKQAEKIAQSELTANQASLAQLVSEEKAAKRSLQLAEKNLQFGLNELKRIKGLWNKRLIAKSLVDVEEQKVIQLEQQVTDLSSRLTTFTSQKSASRAQINASKARLESQLLNVQRTKITAPFTGRVLSKQVDVGQYVSSGKALGTIYATDYVEVNLPLSLAQYELLDMPEAFRNKKVDTRRYPEVVFRPTNSSATHQWKGKVVRSSAALDENSRQISIIARIDNPYEASAENTKAIRIGQYVKANIDGRTFKDVLVIPVVALRHGREVLLNDNGKVSIKTVNVLWNADTEVVVEADSALINKQLIVTPLAIAANGVPVKTLEEFKAEKRKAKQEKAKGQGKEGTPPENGKPNEAKP
ncbi:MAG: Membrane fusion protein of RND family multidrug efflux pump [uncultured Thiotrichaceae bacterium]|uniref:Membrane fusion protein of RND family multidrug efflux pump n=1 Tax=uncultured Thiotrichaceae bacterium TaxID=298394 RepID=A0A6S6SI36_9GAMM|nr:MAG: Membrane fusion protein of RND family multidrug efflux pump [uncultured Thiotrichaceae bacterium]